MSDNIIIISKLKGMSEEILRQKKVTEDFESRLKAIEYYLDKLEESKKSNAEKNNVTD